MALYILKRILQAIPVFFGATLLIYFMVFAMPGDPIAALFGDRQPNPALLERLREQYHLDQPFLVQYFYYISGIFRLDFGISFSGQPVADILARTFPVTLRLAVMAVGIAFILAIIIGLFSALGKGGIFDNSMLVIALVFVAVPIFVLAFLAQYFLAVQLGWFRPTVGARNDWGDLWLPAIVLGSACTPRVCASRAARRSRHWVRTGCAPRTARACPANASSPCTCCATP